MLKFGIRCVCRALKRSNLRIRSRDIEVSFVQGCLYPYTQSAFLPFRTKCVIEQRHKMIRTPWFWNVTFLFLNKSYSIYKGFDVFLISNESLECLQCVAIIKRSYEQIFRVTTVQWREQHFSTKILVNFGWKVIIFIFIHNSKTIWSTEIFHLSLESQSDA